MIRQFELVDLVRSYNPQTDEDLLNRAYVYAMMMHGGQKRASGEDYINHPIEVAAMLTELRLDDSTIATALLHDTIEDTAASYDALAERFGSEIAFLVEGVTKLNRLEEVPRETAQAENFRKLLMATAKDPRVLLVKLADRLHNMRTLKALRPEKAKRIASETIEIFAPLAGRMGMQSYREELEDIAFAVLEPQQRDAILRRFAHLKSVATEAALTALETEIAGVFASAGIEAEVSGRRKRPFSIWRKMKRKNLDDREIESGEAFEHISDVVAFRAIVATEADCYRALGAIHTAWRAVPGRFKDYISGPKSNGYRSLHTTVIGPEGQRVEVQLRTAEMHEVAETGLAAHWAFRDGLQGANRFAVDPYRWLRDLADRVGRGDAPQEFLATAKIEFAEQVYCFTPRGDVVDLPLGATALDFAFAVHTDIGLRAVGARVEGRRVPLSTRLRNGETVEIQRSDAQRLKPYWLDIAVTQRARSAIRRKLRAEAQEASAQIGRTRVMSVFELAGAAFSDKAMGVAAERLRRPGAEELLAEVGEDRLSAQDVLHAVYPEKAKTVDAPNAGVTDPSQPKLVAVRGIGGVRAGRHLSTPAAPCCAPIPGERVVAIRDPGSDGYALHAIDCHTLALYEGAMDRWIDVSWPADAADHAQHLARIALGLANEPGALGAICTLIAEAGANIDNLRFTERLPDFFSVAIDVEVRDVRHVNNILTTLRAQPIVTGAKRLRNLLPLDAVSTSDRGTDAYSPQTGVSVH